MMLCNPNCDETVLIIVYDVI